MIMRNGMLIIAAILFITTNAAQAQMEASQPELHGSFNVTYLSKYVWRGFDIYDDKSGVEASLDLDLYGTGFGFNVVAHRANSSEFENTERWDYTLYYRNRMFNGQSYAMNYRLGWVLYNYPDQPTKGSALPPFERPAFNASLQELNAIMSWPEICPIGIVPTYVLVKMWPHRSGSYSGSRSSLALPPAMVGTASGWAHIFMLDYSFTVADLIPNNPEQKINLHSEFVFNDGVSPVGTNVDHDWTNMVFGISTDINLENNLFLTPGVYHQRTFDDSINEDEDETWFTLGATCKF
jgi:hypothetical protein